ncbi:macrophage mannose receptor 1-like isoform X2 [Pseudorasbora parva]
MTASPDAWHTTTTNTTTSVTDTSSFLIYNEDHNKCVTVVSANVLQAVPCNVSSKAQHFRWISSSRIISLSLSLCLEAENLENWVKIILQPCKELSPMQTWECKDQNLFGLKGLPLHLNYGNSNEQNMMLYKGTGVWSHWLIYGTKENLCSRGYQEMTSIGGNSDGKPCHFPFKVGGQWYADCTADGRDDGQMWCSTEEDFDTDRKWGFCPPKNFAEDQHKKGLSLFYICFFSFVVGVVVIITTAAVIIRRKAKNSAITGTDNTIWMFKKTSEFLKRKEEATNQLINSD